MYTAWYGDIHVSSHVVRDIIHLESILNISSLYIRLWPLHLLKFVIYVASHHLVPSWVGSVVCVYVIAAATISQVHADFQRKSIKIPTEGNANRIWCGLNKSNVVPKRRSSVLFNSFLILPQLCEETSIITSYIIT